MRQSAKIVRHTKNYKTPAVKTIAQKCGFLIHPKSNICLIKVAATCR